MFSDAYCVVVWGIVFHPDFDPEFDALAPVVQDELLAQAKLLEAFGPTLGRPRADTLKGSRHANMKGASLHRGRRGRVWRVAFDPERKPSCWSSRTSRGSPSDGSTDD